MSFIQKLRQRLRALADREALDAELDDELRFHLDRQIAQFVDQGMDPAAARTEALRLFGGVEKTKEECRDERRVGLVDNFVQDVGYAVRTLNKSRGFALLAIVTLALGIGANSAIFSVVNGVVLAPLPYPDSDDLMVVEAGAPGVGRPRISFTTREFYEYRAVAETLDLVEYHSMSFTLLGHGFAKYVETGVVSYDFFDVLGLTTQHGRTFVAADEHVGAEAVLVLSDRFWREEFNADPGVVGEVFEMNDRPHRVIGVLPPIPHYPRYNDVYMPTSACPFRARNENGMDTDRDVFRNLWVFGRLTGGATVDHAEQEISMLAGRTYDRDPAYYEGTDYTARAVSLQEALTEAARPMLMVLIGTVALVLLVACANVANLMVARVMRRERELALRAAMGAGRSRLLRQLLTETILLSVAGGALGLLFASLGLDMLVEFAGRFTERTADIEIDSWVLAFTFVVSVITGVAFGVLPGLWTHADVARALREGSSPQTTTGRTTLRVRGLLIAGQVALSFMLLIGAGLLMTSFIKLSRVDTGFEAENVLTAEISPNWTEYENLDERTELYTELLGALERAPGVVSAAVANTVPLAHGMTMVSVYHVETRPPGLDEFVERANHEAPSGTVSHGWPLGLSPIGISADYFETVGLPILEGRGLTPEEVDGRDAVALLSESARDRYWPDASPIGVRIAIPVPLTATSRQGEWEWHTVVGVVADAKHYGLELETPPAMFASYRSFGGAGLLLVRTSADTQTMGALIQQTLARIAPRQAVENFQTVQSLRSDALATPKLTTTLISLFAALAMVITVAGIGSVLAFSVNQRTHEIGIRMALGAERRAVLGMVLQQGLSMVLVGLALGVVGALWFSNLVATFLYETEPTDPLTFLGVGVVLLLATVIACWLPARRATTIDPVVALRVD